MLNFVNCDKKCFFLFDFDRIRVIGTKCTTKLFFLLISISIIVSVKLKQLLLLDINSNISALYHFRNDCVVFKWPNFIQSLKVHVY